MVLIVIASISRLFHFIMFELRLFSTPCFRCMSIYLTLKSVTITRVGVRALNLSAKLRHTPPTWRPIVFAVRLMPCYLMLHKNLICSEKFPIAIHGLEQKIDRTRRICVDFDAVQKTLTHVRIREYAASQPTNQSEK